MLPAEQESRETSRKLLRHTNGASKQSAKLFENAPDHSVGLFKKLQQSIVKGNEEKARLLSAIDTDTSGKISTVVIDVSDLKILPSESDVRNLLTTDPELIEEEEELYRYGSMRIDHGGASQAVLSKVERQAMVNEINKKSKSREQAMMNEMKEESKSREEASTAREKAMMNEIEKKEKNMVGEIEARSKSREEASIAREKAMMDKIEKKEKNLVGEIEAKSKSREEASTAREEAMVKEIKNMSDLFRKMEENKERSQSELKVLRLELGTVTFACLSISFLAFLSLRRR